MPTYKGNVGHLMQHWTLCELLEIAQQQGVPGLNFIDAHAMAPLARTRESWHDRRFNAVESRVQSTHAPGYQWASKYEWAWHHLAPSIGYPNSAVFVEKVWRGDFALSLCEVDRTTIEELLSWRDRVRRLARCNHAEIFRDDWRRALGDRQGFPSPYDVGLPRDSLTLVSFDPDLISCHPRPSQLDDQQRRRVYIKDLQDVRNHLDDFGGKVLIYLPTYSAEMNPQPIVKAEVDNVLTQGPDDYTRECEIVVNGNMMLLIYSRGLDDGWAAQLAALPRRFDNWLQ